MTTKTIFIVDDEPDMLRSASDLLTDEGYSVRCQMDARKALEQIRSAPPDLVLLDVRMPGMDGFQVCKELKSDPRFQRIPIIMVSIKKEEAHAVTALELGAEDYIRKPYRTGEFLARVRSALRRYETAPVVEDQLQVGPLRLDFNRYALFVDGKGVPLRPKEFELLAFLIRRQGHVLTHATISQGVWNVEHAPGSKTIYFQVEQLRKKLGRYGDWIQSLRGIGYRFEAEE